MKTFKYYPTKKNFHTHVDQSITKIWCCGGKKKIHFENSTNDLSSIGSLCLSDDSMQARTFCVFFTKDTVVFNL